MALVDEIVMRLSSQGVGTSSAGSAWRLVIGEFLPGTIDGSTQAQQICVTPSGGFDQVGEEALLRPTFQVRVRGASTSSTGLEAKMEAVQTALNLTGRITLGSRVYLEITQQGDMLYLGRDEVQRPVYAQNFLAHRSRTT